MARNTENPNTSKTARVINLLSKKRSPASARTEPVESASPESAAPVPPTPIITSTESDVNVSAQIKNALEDALAGELGGGLADLELEPDETETEFVPEEEPEEMLEEIPEDVQTPPPPAPPQPEPASQKFTLHRPTHQASTPQQPAAQQPTPQNPEPPATPSAPVQKAQAPAAAPVQVEQQPAASISALEDNMANGQFSLPPNANLQSTGYINVMQVLVEEKAPKYVELFGLCDCERCLEDVKALALNHLPPKYVVLDKHEMIPRLTLYEGQYSSDITAQLMKACELVRDRPHHSRE